MSGLLPARFAARLLTLALLAFAPAAAAEPPATLPQVALSDGRTLKNVSIRTFDPATQRVLVLADGRAMTVPLALFPAAVAEKLRGAPRSGESVSVVGSGARSSAALSTAADQYHLAQPEPVVLPATPAPRAGRPATGATPAASKPPATPNQAAARSTGINLNAHKAAALKRAQSYYRFEYRAGSNSVAVTALELDVTTPQVVPGWEGRCRTEGKASFELYDSRGRSFQRRTSTFEVITEKKTGDDDLVVLEFSTKS